MAPPLKYSSAVRLAQQPTVNIQGLVSGYTGPGDFSMDPDGHLSEADEERLYSHYSLSGGTYAGGIDYLAWKINRHAGTDIQIKPWQRRWPLVAALTLLPRLLRRGAIR